MWIPDIETRSIWSVVAHAFNPSTLRGRGRQISEIEAILVYRVSSRTARAIQRHSVISYHLESTSSLLPAKAKSGPHIIDAVTHTITAE